MGDEFSDIWAELNSKSTETGWAVGEEEPGYFEDMNWEPTPIDAAPGPPPLIDNRILMSDYRKTTSGDIVSMLLNIYDSKEVFVKELQVILAERLLSSKEYDVEKEVPNPTHTSQTTP
jgi:anaphase-promoting complex subunit 2